AREPAPARHVEFHLDAVNFGAAECDGKADAGVQENVVVGEVVHVAPEVVGVETQFAGETLRDARLVEVASRGWHGQTQDGVVQRGHGRGTGEKQIFKGRRLKDA